MPFCHVFLILFLYLLLSILYIVPSIYPSSLNIINNNNPLSLQPTETAN
jgi:hypothetical protein